MTTTAEIVRFMDGLFDQLPHGGSDREHPYEVFRKLVFTRYPGLQTEQFDEALAALAESSERLGGKPITELS